MAQPLGVEMKAMRLGLGAEFIVDDVMPIFSIAYKTTSTPSLVTPLLLYFFSLGLHDFSHRFEQHRLVYVNENEHALDYSHALRIT